MRRTWWAALRMLNDVEWCRDPAFCSFSVRTAAVNQIKTTRHTSTQPLLQQVGSQSSSGKEERFSQQWNPPLLACVLWRIIWKALYQHCTGKGVCRPQYPTTIPPPQAAAAPGRCWPYFEMDRICLISSCFFFTYLKIKWEWCIWTTTAQRRNV